MPEFIIDTPTAVVKLCQTAINTYVSETNKTASVFRAFPNEAGDWRPHPKSMTVAELMKHQLLSERTFFSRFLGFAEPLASDVLSADPRSESFATRLIELATPRLAYLASQPEQWWLEPVLFFDVDRERHWVFWRRVLHSAHHRTQLTVYLRLLDVPVPPIYGPTADTPK